MELPPDSQRRHSDDRLATQPRHQPPPHPLQDTTSAVGATTPTLFQPRDFAYGQIARTCVGQAGKALYRKGQSRTVAGHVSGTERDCGACPLRDQCLRTPGTTRVRNVAFIREPVLPKLKTASARMWARIDAEVSRARCGGRCGAVEPVFGNLRHNKHFARFTMRGRAKVDGQWQQFCLVHYIETLAHHGDAA